MCEFYDVAIIGGGIGGYTAALELAESNLKVVIIEKQYIGGTCLNFGCIPTKNLIGISELYSSTNDLIKKNIFDGSINLNFKEVKNKIITDNKKLRTALENRIKNSNIEIIYGSASFLDSDTIIIKVNSQEKTIKAKKYIIATGTRPLIPNIIGIDTEGVVTNEEFFSGQMQIPSSITIVGGGVIGLEVAFALSKIGIEVSIVEKENDILINYDYDVQQLVKTKLSEYKIRLYCGYNVDEIFEDGNIICQINKNEEILLVESEKVLLATGRVPNIENLGLENTMVKIEDKKIIVDSKFKTKDKNIYAIGDVNGKHSLAYTASAEAEVVANDILGRNIERNFENIPICLFTEPEISISGITEIKAKKLKLNTLIARYNIYMNGRAYIENKSDGFIKLIANKEDKTILGATICCNKSTEFISIINLAINYKINFEELVKELFPHPTIVESIRETAKNLVKMS